MSEPSAPEQALAAIAGDLLRLHRQFALIGGLAVSVRGEVRFTRDVDLVVLVADDEDLLLIAEREYHRGQDLEAKLATVLAAAEEA